MTTNKHTQGPGNYSLNESHSGHEVWTLGENKADIIYVADVQAKANAALIAAAPNLLAALEGLLTAYGFGDPSLSELDLEDDEREAIDVARAAIAKARGEVQS